MAITYKYTKVPRKDGTLRFAPYIPVYLKSSKDSFIEITALVDSGADFSVMSIDLAKLLGFKLSNHEETTAGIGGNVKVKETQVNIMIKGDHEKYVCNIPFLVLLEDIDVPLLLGRNGFFEHFHVTFKQNLEKISLKKVNPEQRRRFWNARVE